MQTLPEHFDEKVAELHLAALGVELTKEQAEYLRVDVAGRSERGRFRTELRPGAGPLSAATGAVVVASTRQPTSSNPEGGGSCPSTLAACDGGGSQGCAGAQCLTSQKGITPMGAKVRSATSLREVAPQPQSVVVRAADALTSTGGLVVIFLVLQVVAAASFREVDPEWPNGRMNWDGEHYSDLSTQGYPPLGAKPSDDALGSYAFFPLYPMLIRALAAVSGLGVGTLAPLISVSAAAVALVLADRWLRGLMRAAGAAAAFVGLVLSPAFPVLQMGYTEGISLLLLVVAWRSFSMQRWVPYGLAVTVLSLTRPLAVPLAAVALVAVGVEYRRGIRGSRLRAHIVAALLTGLSAAVWPAVLWAMTGRPTAYLDAMATFRRDTDVPNVLAAAFAYPALGLAVFGALGSFAWIGLRMLPAEVPTVVRAWVVVYPLYIAMAAVPSSSPLRYLMFEFPIALVLVPWLRRPVVRGLVVVAAALLSVVLSSWWVFTFVPAVIDGTLP